MAQSISQEAIGATGLPGATAASRHAGATASGAPVSGTFAVGDFVIDQTGKVYVCTVAGTPGTWVQTGGGTYAPGTIVQSWCASNSLTFASATNITSMSLTAGTWLINYQGLFFDNVGTSPYYIDLWVGPNSASGTGNYGLVSGGVNAFSSTTNSYSQLTGCVSVVLASTTTVYLSAIGNANVGLNSTSGTTYSSTKISGMTAVRTA